MSKPFEIDEWSNIISYFLYFLDVIAHADLLKSNGILKLVIISFKFLVDYKKNN